MRKVKVYVSGLEAGDLTEITIGKDYRFEYRADYTGLPVSLTLPLTQSVHNFDRFPPFFEGLLPEGYQLEGLLNQSKIDRNDLFSQLVLVGNDMVGNVTLSEIES